MSTVKPNLKLTKHSSTRVSAVDFTRLPAYQYRHVNWSDLKNMDIPGPAMRGPRVRATPSRKDDEFDSVPESSANYQPHIYQFSSQQDKNAASREVKQVRAIKSKIEDWENVTKINLSYQEIGGNFQSYMLSKKLKKLIRCEMLILSDNRLSDLTEYTFPCMEVLNLSLNIFESFEKLPKCPKLRVLNLAGNKITSIDGIGRFSSLEEVVLRNNPLVWTVPEYRQLLFDVLPSLLSVDGVTREDLARRVNQDV